MKYDENLEIAILYKKVSTVADQIGDCFYPYRVIEGYYCDDDECFYDLDGTAYKHIIENPENFGYVDRISYGKAINSKFNKQRIYNKILKSRKEDIYFVISEDNNSLGLPIIIYIKDEVLHLFYDTDTILHYLSYYPNDFELINSFDKIEFEIWNDVEDKEPVEVAVKFDIDIADAYKKITDVIIDQDRPIRQILTAIWKQNEGDCDISRNILINGGTGVGKTAIFRILSKLIDVPCFITSATEYSSTGYKGKDVEEMLVSLVNRAKGDIDLAEHGILIIDELDKISETSKGEAKVNQRGVQENLLKILEDAVINIDTDYGVFDFDTSKLMVVGMGSWTMAKLDDRKSIGFNSEDVQKKNYKTLTREDMIDNGLIPDLVGRFNTIIQMNDLNYDSFLKIIKQSKNSQLKINKEFLNKKGIELVTENGTIESIAKKVSKSPFGAREIDNVIENALEEALFEIATNPNKYSKLIINKDTIEDNKNYKLVLKK